MAHITLQDILQQIDSCGFQSSVESASSPRGRQNPVALYALLRLTEQRDRNEEEK